MPRPEKVQAVAEIKERLEEASAVFLAEFAGLSVKEQQELRRGLRSNDAEFKVVKMTLAKRAADELGLDVLDDLLTGPTGLTFAQGDPVTAAAALADFAKTHDALKVKGGLLGGEFLTPERVGELARIEPREVLLAKIAGAMKAPMSQMAGLLAALPRNAATAMQQLLDIKEQEAPAAAEPEAPEAAEAEPEAAEPEAEAVAEPEADAADEVPEAEAPPADAPEAPDDAPDTDGEDPDGTAAPEAEEEE